LRFDVLAVGNIKALIFWNVVQCCLVHGYKCFEGICLPIFNPEDGGSIFLQNNALDSFLRSSVQIPAGTLAFLTEVFMVFLSLCR
jgi:hypothetical protein